MNKHRTSYERRGGRLQVHDGPRELSTTQKLRFRTRILLAFMLMMALTSAVRVASEELVYQCMFHEDISAWLKEGRLIRGDHLFYFDTDTRDARFKPPHDPAVIASVERDEFTTTFVAASIQGCRPFMTVVEPTSASTSREVNAVMSVHAFDAHRGVVHLYQIPGFCELQEVRREDSS